VKAKKQTFTVVAVCATAIVLFGIVGFMTSKQGTSVDVYASPAERLSNTNEDFRLGSKLAQDGNPEAIGHFQRALDAAETNIERSVVLRAIASSYFELGTEQDVKNLFMTLGEVAFDETFDPIFRSIALYRIGELRHTFPDVQVSRMIFSDERFSPILDEARKERGRRDKVKEEYSKDIDGQKSSKIMNSGQFLWSVAYKKIYENAIEIYPAAPIVVRNAELAALQVWDSYLITDGHPEIFPEHEKLKLEISRGMLAPTAPPPFFEQMPDRQHMLGQMYYRRAKISALQTSMGELSAYPPESDFIMALKELAGADQYLATAHLEYANYLATLGDSARQDDIKALLVPFYSSTRFDSSHAVRVLKNQKAAKELRVSAKLARLASIDPQFKKYLEKLGWKF
jgi:tetratricopeptide (TPR) repeat protein